MARCPAARTFISLRSDPKPWENPDSGDLEPPGRLAVAKPLAQAGIIAGAGRRESPRRVTSRRAKRLTDRSRLMKFLGYAFRFVTDFLLLAMAYFSLNFMEKYQQRAVIAALILAFALMRTVSVIRSFNFFQKIERLENETKRLAS